jgi:hypothetical protein
MQVFPIIFNACNLQPHFVSLSILQHSSTMTKVNGKQERMVVHLEIGGQHHYYGNLKALCDHWDKDALGVGYAYLRNYGISEEKPFRNAKCVIRRGIIVTSQKKVNI